jgi:hypothetical protein
MVAHRRRQRQGKTLALGIMQGDRVFEALVGLKRKVCDGLPEGQELLFSVAYELDEDVTLSSTAAAKTTHDFFELLRKVLGLALELGRALATLPAYGANELERFFWALYSVVASVTR